MCLVSNERRENALNLRGNEDISDKTGFLFIGTHSI